MKLEEIRNFIDEIDQEILDALVRRKSFIKQIASTKKSADVPILDENREKAILANLKEKAKKLGLEANFISALYSIIFENSKKEQEIQDFHAGCKVEEIGLIGYGRFGALMVGYLSKNFKVFIYDKDQNKTITGKNAFQSSLEEVCKKEIIILSVPISEIKNVLENIKPLLKRCSLIIDVCSVKEYPVKLMQEILPEHVQILATHPLFGPDTAADSLSGRKIVVCKIRIDDLLYEQVKVFLKKIGLIVIETTPKNHDEEIAKSLVLTHFISRSLMELKMSSLNIDTRGYKNLMQVLDTVKNDTWQLFQDMNNYNKYSKKIRQDFIKSTIEINGRLEK